ncbi:MAG: GGDEF domain-containing protein [Devosia sp.]
MTSLLSELEHEFVPESGTPGRRMLPGTIILLVFAMVVIAVGGFAYISAQQQDLAALRTESGQMRAALQTLTEADAGAAHFAGGDKNALTGYFRALDQLRLERSYTLDQVIHPGDASPIAPSIDILLKSWGDAAALAVDGDAGGARVLLAERRTGALVGEIAEAVEATIANGDAELRSGEERLRFSTLAVLLLQVLSGTLAMSGMFYAFRSSAREAHGKSAALRSADTSREQVARLFEMADVLQSATDYTDANAVLKATVSDLIPGFSGALYVFNNSRDRLVLSTSWAQLSDEHVPETIPPDQCWALKRGKPHLNQPGGKKLCCDHHHGGETVLEIPMIARGEIMGLFQLSATGADAEQRLEGVTVLASALADGMSLALANMALREKLRNQALRDPLTGLYNRRYMEDTLARFVRLAERENREVSIVMVDLDHFKRLNDENGHAFGDSVLRDAAATLIGGLRETDIVCRYGGEELVVILPDCNLDRAAGKAEVLRARIEGLTQTHGAPISASFGVASVPYTSGSVPDLLAAADAALYRAKQAGRNQVQMAPTRPFKLDRLEDQIAPMGVALQAAE